MRTPLWIILACLLTTPALAAAASPAATLHGEVGVSRTLGPSSCHDGGPATLHLRTDSVPESGWLRVAVETACGAPRLVARAQLEADGWRLGDGQTMHGHVRPLDEEARAWSFRLEVLGCPPGVICEFPLARVLYQGVVHRPEVTTQ